MEHETPIKNWQYRSETPASEHDASAMDPVKPMSMPPASHYPGMQAYQGMPLAAHQLPAASAEARYQHMQNLQTYGVGSPQQQQQQQAQQQSAYETVHMKDVVPQHEAVKQLDFKQLEADFRRIGELKLTDNLEALDELYLQASALRTKTFALNLLLNLYQSVYADLFDRYSGLSSWAVFVLGMLVFGSAEKLERACSTNRGFRPIVKNNAAFTRLNKRLGKRSAEPAEPGESEEPPAKQDSEGRREAITKHPFFKMRIFREHTLMFDLGKCLKYCVPSEFGVLNAAVEQSSLPKYAANKATDNFNGLKVIFRTPVVECLDVRMLASTAKSRQGVFFMQMRNMGQLKDVLEKMVPDSKCLPDAFQMGNSKDMRHVDLTKPDVDIDYVLKKDDVYCKLCVVASVNCFVSASGFLNCRSYTSSLYLVKNEMLSISEEDVQRVGREHQQWTTDAMKKLQAHYKEHGLQYEDEEAASGPAARQMTPEEQSPKADAFDETD